MSQKTYIARKGADTDFAAVTVSSLEINGPAASPGLTITGAGSKSAAAYAGVGAAWADGATPDFAADQAYLLITVGSTVYRIPLWANA